MHLKTVLQQAGQTTKYASSEKKDKGTEKV